MIDFDFSSKCTGCGVCVDACPKGCISLRKNSKGFLVPDVKINDCVSCGLCDKVCPVLNAHYLSFEKRKLYRAFNLNEKIREKGSSGSIFYIVAKYVIENGGCVFGAAFTDDFKLRHVKTENLPDVLPLMKSKYLQSETTGVYSEVKNELKKNRLVLFVGTPCQTQALYNFLGAKKSENLILMDFICHGVPCQELFDRCLKNYEEKNNCKVVDFSFRQKTEERLHNCKIESISKEGERKTFIINSADYPFYNGYLKYIIFRNCCYKCQFVGEDRVSDFTLGDFWGLEKTEDIKDFNRGYSMLYVNSAKGANLLKILAEEMDLKEYDTNSPIAFNYAYLKPTRRSILNRFFMWDYNRVSQETLEKRYFGKSKEYPFFKKLLWYIIYKLKI